MKLDIPAVEFTTTGMHSPTSQSLFIVNYPKTSGLSPLVRSILWYLSSALARVRFLSFHSSTSLYELPCKCGPRLRQYRPRMDFEYLCYIDAG